MDNNYIIKLKHGLYEKEYDDKFINRCCKYAEKLINKNLPVFFDEEHIHRVLRTQGISLENNYHAFDLISDNKIRTILAPSKRLKARQRWILDNILNKIKVSKYAHGFELNRSIKTHAELHANHDFVVCMDIKDFFPSITEEKVYTIFKNIGYTSRASQELAKLCCFKGVLPQGAPTSPKLANIICKKMDWEIQRYSKANNITYSRYADDLTFSSNSEMCELITEITAIVKKYDFSINSEKTQTFAYGEPKFITGLVVQNGNVRIPKRYKRELRKEIHFCQKFGGLIHLQNSNATHFVNYREHLYGKAYYVHMIEPDIGEKFLDELDKISWPEYML